MKTSISILALSAGLLCATAVHADIEYRLTIIDPPGRFDATGAKDVNASGTVVGWTNGSGAERGFRWTPSGPSATAGTIEVLEAPAGCKRCDTSALRVNGRGHAVGWFRDGTGVQHPVLWTDTAAIDLGLLPGYTGALARDINDQGVIVGTTTGPNVLAAAFRWTPSMPNGSSGTLETLPEVPGSTSAGALSINANGSVVGSAKVGGRTYAARWSGGGGERLTPGAAWHSNQATAINDTGWFFGSGTDDNSVTQGWGFSGVPGALGWLLGTLPGVSQSEVHDINGPGSAVGEAYDHNTGLAYVWRATVGIRDLNGLIGASSFELRRAFGINDVGRIVGEAYGGGTLNRAFLLVPKSRLRVVTDAVAVNAAPYYEVCDPLHLCLTLKVTNISAQALAGPLHLALPGLVPGRDLVDADGSYLGAPFVTADTERLQPGDSVELRLQFSVEREADLPRYDLAFYSGAF